MAHARASLDASHAAPLLAPPSPAPSSPPPPHPVPKGHYLTTLTLTACISGLLFGYDTASISSALLYLAPALSTPTHAVTTWDKSAITSATSLGALAGGLLAGVAADRWGRKRVIVAADVVFFAGALWQALARGVGAMVAGRAVVGVGVGVGSLVMPLYIAELAPPSHRGRLVVLSVLFVTLGQLLAYTLGLALSPPTLPAASGWRWMLGLGGAPALLQGVLMLWMPETPRHLLAHGQRRAAAAALALVYGTTSPPVLSHLLSEITAGLPPPGPTSLRRNAKALLTVPANRRALALTTFLQALQQACGFNSLMYFSATLFAALGFRAPTAAAMLVAATNAAATAVAFALIDRVGRRRMLLRSLAGMAAGLVLCAAGFAALPASFLGGSAASSPPPSSPLALAAVLTGIPLFVASYALGLGPIPWLAQSEFFPQNVRGLGTGLATATNWACNLLVAATFLGLVQALGAGAVFAGYAVVVMGGWGVAGRIYPETKGMGMEEVGGVLREGWGV
ncbi:general substrate transporter [Geopyxis carbonaria]|nr:general substrate transporter [Geopyxis carbonaria]